jgi:hypothetical protein
VFPTGRHTEKFYNLWYIIMLKVLYLLYKIKLDWVSNHISMNICLSGILCKIVSLTLYGNKGWTKSVPGRSTYRETMSSVLHNFARSVNGSWYITSKYIEQVVIFPWTFVCQECLFKKKKFHYLTFLSKTFTAFKFCSNKDWKELEQFHGYI